MTDSSLTSPNLEKVVIKDPGVLIAKADPACSYVVIHRGCMSRDEDQSWLDTQEQYIHQYEMEFVTQLDTPTTWDETDRSLLYAIPQAAAQLRALPDDELTARIFVSWLTAKDSIAATIRKDLKRQLQYRPDPRPLWDLGSRPGKLHAYGNNDQVVIVHGLLIDDDDPLWSPAREHIRLHGMDEFQRVEGAAADFNMGAVGMRYGTPQFRATLTDENLEQFRRQFGGDPS
jgi:hypothetical protein